VWVEPDRPKAVVDGIRDWKNRPLLSDWERYDAENSWDENAKRVLSAFRD